MRVDECDEGLKRGLRPNWSIGVLENWPPARRAYASERVMVLVVEIPRSLIILE
jgi:hypothetical protein